VSRTATGASAGCQARTEWVRSADSRKAIYKSRSVRQDKTDCDVASLARAQLCQADQLTKRRGNTATNPILVQMTEKQPTLEKKNRQQGRHDRTHSTLRFERPPSEAGIGSLSWLVDRSLDAPRHR
jgi:hypothetical protein